MQDNARKITYGAMMIALFAVLLGLAFYIPFVGMLVMFFIPLPIILYRLRYDRSASVIMTAVGVMLSLLIGGILLVPFALAFGLMGLVIGDTMQSKKTKLYTSMAAGLTFLVIMIVTYVSMVFLLGINIVEEMMITLRETQKEMTSFMVNFGEQPENFAQQLEESMMLYETSIPSFFILGAFSFAFIIVVLNALLVNRLGHKVPKYPPFRDMKLPSMTVWCYLLIVLLPLIANVDQGTTLNLVYVNATVILRFLFFIQGISFIHYYMNQMKLPMWGTIIATALALLLSPITVLLGIVDAGLNIRAWISRDKGKEN